MLREKNKLHEILTSTYFSVSEHSLSFSPLRKINIYFAFKKKNTFISYIYRTTFILIKCRLTNSWWMYLFYTNQIIARQLTRVEGRELRIIER